MLTVVDQYKRKVMTGKGGTEPQVLLYPPPLRRSLILRYDSLRDEPEH